MLMATRNPAIKPVEVGIVCPIIYKVSKHPTWLLGISAINSSDGCFRKIRILHILYVDIVDGEKRGQWRPPKETTLETNTNYTSLRCRN